MEIGFFHLGQPEHGVCRYGHLLANEAKKRAYLKVLESEAILTGNWRKDIQLLKNSARNLSSSDVVHIQFTEEIWGTNNQRFRNLWIFCTWCKARIVVTIHDTEPANEQIKQNRNVRQLLREIRFQCKLFLYEYGVIQNFSPANSWTRNWLVNHTQLSIVCSEEEKGRLAAINASEKISAIPHFIEERTSLPGREESRKFLGLESFKVVTLIGFIYGGKGYKLLIEAIPFLPDNIMIVFAGGAAPGAEKIFTELSDLAKKLGVFDRLRITGYLEEKELEKYLMATDVPVCPYRIAYASSSLSTWLSASRPVLTSDLPLFQEYKKLEPDAINTFFPYTSKALSEEIQKMLTEPENKLAASRLRDRLSIKNVLDEHLVSYKKLFSLFLPL